MKEGKISGQLGLIVFLIFVIQNLALSNGRDDWQMPDRIIRAMDVQPGQHIADIGGKDGYFTLLFAKAVGPKGVAYCCDIDAGPMKRLQDKAAKENLKNVVTVLAATDRPMLPPSSLDIIFFCNTNHHLYDRIEYYKNLIPLLCQDGKLVVVDWKAKRQDIGPPPGHSVAKKVVIDEMNKAGWTLVKEETFLPYQYFLVFKPQ
jgi:ubiquinone/menaquinone biosynthesis C-methylase UbiE